MYTIIDITVNKHSSQNDLVQVREVAKHIIVNIAV